MKMKLLWSFRLWNLGEPRKLFLMVVNRDLQWWLVVLKCGEPGGVIGVSIFEPVEYKHVYKHYVFKERWSLTSY